jgi:hypothetical protein
MKHKKDKIQKPSPADIVKRLQSDPIYLASIAVFENFTDEEVKEYGAACSATLGVLVSWAKRATFGFATMDDLKALFFSDDTLPKVKAFFVRTIGLTMGDDDDGE